jgi:hypothetical protein
MNDEDGKVILHLSSSLSSRAPTTCCVGMVNFHRLQLNPRHTILFDSRMEIVIIKEASGTICLNKPRRPLPELSCCGRLVIGLMHRQTEAFGIRTS